MTFCLQWQVTLGSRLKFGLLVVRRKGQPDRNFCVGAYPSLHNFTAVRDDINYRPLSDLTYVSAEVDTCQPELGVQVSDKYVLVNGTNGDNSTSGNCTIQTRAENIQLNNGTGLLLNTSLALRYALFILTWKNSSNLAGLLPMILVLLWEISSLPQILLDKAKKSMKVRRYHRSA